MISIIIPIHNMEKKLDRCIKSVVNQTYHDLDIILVDDGSEDRSGEICDFWSQRDQRISVVHKKVGGGKPGEKFRTRKCKRSVGCFCRC